MSMKKSNDTIGIRTRDLPACSAVPQPTAPPQPTDYTGQNWYLFLRLKSPAVAGKRNGIEVRTNGSL
jgi:hypothetical protein